MGNISELSIRPIRFHTTYSIHVLTKKNAITKGVGVFSIASFSFTFYLMFDRWKEKKWGSLTDGRRKNEAEGAGIRFVWNKTKRKWTACCRVIFLSFFFFAARSLGARMHWGRGGESTSNWTNCARCFFFCKTEFCGDQNDLRMLKWQNAVFSCYRDVHRSENPKYKL